MSLVLGIETSCDETGIAIVEDGRNVIVNLVASQIDVHAQFGGVVPEIASREHTKIITQLVEQALSHVDRPVDAVAVTAGPGLMGSLMVGLNFAKAFAYARDIPLIPVNHLEGHIFSVFLNEDVPEWPFLTLLVSGGHTCLIDCEEPHKYRLLGTTRDDAVGESFDKVARLLDLSYPGGPSIQRAAAGGNDEAFDFPRAMVTSGTLDFSYSGLKTAVLYATREGTPDTADVAASFQAAAIDALIVKTKRAMKKLGYRRLAISGGVAANALLRERAAKDIRGEVFVPAMQYCVDNGAMIAAVGDSLLDRGRLGGLDAVANPGLALV